jgi:hypothetical protein
VPSTLQARADRLFRRQVRNATTPTAAAPAAASSEYAANPAMPAAPTPAATNGAAQQAIQAMPVIQPIALPVLDIDDVLTLPQMSEAKPWSTLHGQVVSPNKPMQRAGTDKVLGRGRLNVVHEQVCRARVLSCLRAVADGCRYAALEPQRSTLREPKC